MDKGIGKRVRWILTDERQPSKRGYYFVATAKSTREKSYYWNGDYWVTPGHCPAKGIYSWREEDWDDDC